MYAIPFQIFWTENYEFRFPNLKIWVQFSDTIINRNSFCIHATVNIRNSISDVLDLKLWVQIPEHKNLSSVFRTFFWGRYLKKIEEKNQKSFKVPKCPKTFPSVQTCFGAIFLKIFFPSVLWSRRKFSKKSKKSSKMQKCPRSFPKSSKLVLNMFCGNFFEKKIAPCSMEGWAFEIFQKNQNFSKFRKCQESFPKESKRVLNMLWGNVFEKNFAQCSLQGFLDFLDWKLWVQIPEFKNMCSVFRT